MMPGPVSVIVPSRSNKKYWTNFPHFLKKDAARDVLFPVFLSDYRRPAPPPREPPPREKPPLLRGRGALPPRENPPELRPPPYPPKPPLRLGGLGALGGLGGGGGGGGAPHLRLRGLVMRPTSIPLQKPLPPPP